MPLFRRLDRYLLRESLPPFLFGLSLFSGLAVVSLVLPRLPWIVGVPILELLQWFSLMLPGTLVQALPVALVFAVLLGVGRLATANELVAIQIGGISFRRLVVGLLLLALLIAALGLALSEWVVPGANRAVGTMYWRLSSGSGGGLFRLIRHEVPIGTFTLHFEGVDRRTDTLQEVRVQRWEGKRLTVLFADHAVFEEAGLRLFDYEVVIFDVAALGAPVTDAAERIGNLVPVHNRPGSADQSLLLTADFDLDEIIARFSGGGFDDSRSISRLWADARSSELGFNHQHRALVILHRRLAESVANLTLLLAALPLSVLYARSRGVAFGLSLVVTLVWYLLLTLGQLFAQTGVVPVWFGLWFGNLALGASGFYLFLRRTRFR